jgi:hypothetical protein
MESQPNSMPAPHRLVTIGHSQHEMAYFLELLCRAGVTAVADVRTSPYSGRHPQYNREELQACLKKEGLAYVFMGEQLGGRPGRPSLYDDEGRVDYERVRATEFFQEGLARLERAREKYTVALLCSEEDPLSCHRGLMIAPALLARGLDTLHLRGDGAAETMAQMEQRLLAETRVGAGMLDGLFAATLSAADRAAILADAYRKMARKKAYRLKPGESAESLLEQPEEEGL